MELKSTIENLETSIHQQMIKLHNKIYKYKVFNYIYMDYDNKLSSTGWLIKYNKDKRITIRQSTKEDIREFKLKELGI